MASRDNGSFFWKVSSEGSHFVTPKAGSTIYAGIVAHHSGVCDSAHAAEIAAASSLQVMAEEQRVKFGLAEATLATRNANEDAAQAASARLAKL